MPIIQTVSNESKTVLLKVLMLGSKVLFHLCIDELSKFLSYSFSPTRN